MAVMNRHVCPVENWYGALRRHLHSKAPFISVPSWAGAAASQKETLGLTALLCHWRACPSQAWLYAHLPASHHPFAPLVSVSGGPWDVDSSVPEKGGLGGWYLRCLRYRPRGLGNPFPPVYSLFCPPGPTTSPALLTPLRKGAPRPAAPWMMSPSSGKAWNWAGQRQPRPW